MLMKEIEKFLDVNEVSALLGVKASWVRYAVLKKLIPYVKVGSLVRFKKSDLMTWQDSLSEEKKQ